MNVGCGTGGTIRMLEQFGDVDNVDISDDAIKFMKKAGFEKIHKVDGIKLPFKDNTFDMVGAFDVLEHIDTDEAALKEWRRVLKPGGAVVLSVPAYRFLWGDHDISLYHHRRYTRRELVRKATGAGLDKEVATYAIVFSLPLIVGFRMFNKLSGRKTDSETSYVEVPKFINSLFTWLLYVEAFFHRYITFPFGTSVMAILRKKN